jgi:hypothetical protein
MILSWVLTPILTFFAGLFGDLPTVDLSFFPSASTIGQSMGGLAAEWAPWFPWSFLSDIVTAVFLIILPAFIVFELVQWGYRELPDILGVGPS